MILIKKNYSMDRHTHMPIFIWPPLIDFTQSSSSPSSLAPMKTDFNKYNSRNFDFTVRIFYRAEGEELGQTTSSLL